MILLITGATHTGKTRLAQRLLEQNNIPYLSMDHVKMGLIRSGNTPLTPYDDEEMTEYLWPIIREIIKTAIENGQNLIVEGGYVPADWAKDFSPEYLREINFYCLVMTERYIRAHFDEIVRYASVIEQRGADEDFTVQTALDENQRFFAAFGQENLIVIDDDYEKDMERCLDELEK